MKTCLCGGPLVENVCAYRCLGWRRRMRAMARLVGVVNYARVPWDELPEKIHERVWGNCFESYAYTLRPRTRK